MISQLNNIEIHDIIEESPKYKEFKSCWQYEWDRNNCDNEGIWIIYHIYQQSNLPQKINNFVGTFKYNFFECFSINHLRLKQLFKELIWLTDGEIFNEFFNNKEINNFFKFYF